MIEVWRFQDVILVAQQRSRVKVAIPLDEVDQVISDLRDAAEGFDPRARNAFYRLMGAKESDNGDR